MIVEINFINTSLQINNQKAFISDINKQINLTYQVKYKTEYTIQYLKSYFDTTTRDTSAL